MVKWNDVEYFMMLCGHTGGLIFLQKYLEWNVQAKYELGEGQMYYNDENQQSHCWENTFWIANYFN